MKPARGPNLARDRIVTRAGATGLALGAVLGGGYTSALTLMSGGASVADSVSAGAAGGLFIGGITGIAAGLGAGFAAAAVPYDGTTHGARAAYRRHVRTATTTATIVIVLVALTFLTGGWALSSLELSVVYLAIPVVIAGSSAFFFTPWLLGLPNDATGPANGLHPEDDKSVRAGIEAAFPGGTEPLTVPGEAPRDDGTPSI